MALAPARASMLATIGIVGLALFAGLIIVLHVLESDLAGPDHTMSEFALGRFGALMTTAFVAGGIGSLAIALTFLVGEPRARAAGILIGVWGIGLFVAAIFPTDPYGTTDATASSAGQIHNLVSGLSFVLVGAGLITLGVTSRKWSGWAGRGTAILTFGILGLLSAVTLFLPIHIPEGVLQRIMLACFLVGLTIAAWGARDASAIPLDATPA